MEIRTADSLVLILSRATLSEDCEYLSLVRAAGIKKAVVRRIKVQQPQPHSYVGRGQLSRLQEELKDSQVKTMLVNIDLGATQQRNLERALRVSVKDRTALILTIFAQRARTYQGKLQVELAQLEYENSRLVRGWTHLERQRGAIGQRGGAGEKQLEVDRRLLQTRMGKIRKKITKLKKQRQLSCNARTKAGLPTVSLVGYTNAGKSTLFNALTKSTAYASEQLFATLDPTIRRVRWDQGNFLLADTVGFIENLSPSLLESFAATLSEIKQSRLIIHLIDISDGDCERKKEVVDGVLESLGAGEIDCLTVYNKIDQCNMKNQVRYDWQGNPHSLWVSAQKCCGLELLCQAINKKLRQRETPLFSVQKTSERVLHC